MNPRIDSRSWLSSIGAATIPLALGLYWVLYSAAGPEVASTGLRAFVTAMTVALALQWFDIPITRAETQYAATVSLFLALLIVPSLLATDPLRAFRDLAKMGLICSIGLGLARALRDRRTARAFGYAMLLGSTVLSGFILYVYLQHAGLALPHYEELRRMKGILSQQEGLSLNAIGFSAIFMYLTGLCLVPPAGWNWCLAGIVFTTAAILTGSRAPAGIAITSVVILIGFQFMHSSSCYIRAFGWIITILLAVSVLAVPAVLSREEIVTLTEGRSALWEIAWSNFTERPLFGNGLESWRDDISKVPGEYSVNAGAEQIAGAYHNEYMTLMSEGGLAALLPALAIAVWLLACCHWIAYRSSLSRVNGTIILFGCIVLLLRSLIEVPGLFGYAQEPADYLAYMFVAIVIGELSAHEDTIASIARKRRLLAYSHLNSRPFLMPDLETKVDGNPSASYVAFKDRRC